MILSERRSIACICIYIIYITYKIFNNKTYSYQFVEYDLHLTRTEYRPRVCGGLVPKKDELNEAFYPLD